MLLLMKANSLSRIEEEKAEALNSEIMPVIFVGGQDTTQAGEELQECTECVSKQCMRDERLLGTDGIV